MKALWGKPASVSASLIGERLRNKEQGRHKAALGSHADESGSVAATDVSAPEPPSIDTKTGRVM